MAETLFFRNRDEVFEWLSFDSSGQVLLRGQGTQAEFSEAIEAADFQGQAVCVVAGEDVFRTEAKVPSKQYRQILQAVPYVVEEELAMDVEDCFFALGERRSTGEVPVAVVSLDKIDAWTQDINTFGFKTGSMVSESALVYSASTAGAVIDEDRVHIGQASGACLTTRLSQLPLAVSMISDLDEIEIWVPETQSEAIELQISEIRTGEAEVKLVSTDETAFEKLCRGFDGSEINLLQGRFKVAEVRTGSNSVWRSVAVLLVTAVFLSIATQVGQGWYLADRAEILAAETRAIYKKAFPNDKNVRDIKRRWNSHIGKVEADNVFLALLAQSSQGLNAAGLSLSNVNFNESRGDLILQVVGARSEALVQYAQQLAAQGLEAEIGTITQEDNGVKGSIKIRGGAS